MTDAVSSEGEGQSEDRFGPGHLVLVVGPSGAGKDTLIRLVQHELAARPEVVFPRRVVTRDASSAEDNEALTPAEFETRRLAGAFALVWQAHGLDYAVPIAIDADIMAGRTVVLNISRRMVAPARRRYRRVTVAYVDASPEIRAARLLQRGRETISEITERLATAEQDTSLAPTDVLILNDGPPAQGAGQLLKLISAQS